MKRAMAAVVVAATAVAGLLFAQAPERALLKSPQGEASVSTLELNSQLYLAADDFVKAMGGTMEPDGAGFKVTLLGKPGAFAVDNQYGVVRDELIAMPGLPVVIEGRAFVPWQFFRGFLATAGDLDLQWDPQTRVFTVSPRVRQLLTASISVIDLDDITKVVVQLSGKTQFTISRRQQSYVVKFGNPIGSPFTEQSYQNPHLARAIFRASEVEFQLTGADVVGSAYRLDDPFRVVLDLRTGAPAVAPSTPGAINLPQQRVPGIRTIVIDPGHGGSDTGAIGPNGTEEKAISLALARKLSASLSKKLKARVVLTRNSDEAIPLTQRTAIANEYQADLFLSIHLNSSLRKGAQGTETYFLSLDASDELSRQVAERENEADTAPSPAAPEGDLKFILWDLAQQEYLKESSDLAETIQDELSKATNTENRGVKQAPFRVLIGATMPAALVEVGFISNPDEESKLTSSEHQDKLVAAIVGAVERFKNQYESRIGVTPAPSVGAPAPAATPAPTPAAPVTTAPPTASTGTSR
ncbi:MAG: N-acetylmuramoyl-L-alanine amidase [Thermoanaerobaculia bacterium]|nr:N-acetylmuramoyl-L-alanine amidase [Thermoanaerobaculia bacterium]